MRKTPSQSTSFPIKIFTKDPSNLLKKPNKLSSMAWDSDYRYGPRPVFERIFRCLPFSKYKSPHLETGDKIIMPPSSLAQLLSLPIKSPFLFKIESYNSDKISHCGVLEFEADEGCVYMPEWMMSNLNVREGSLVILRDAALSKGVYMKLRPHSTSFIELDNTRAVLERTLRGFSCLSRGDTIMIKHNGRDFYIDVLEVVPRDAVSLIETDCQVDFAQPLDYEEAVRVEEQIKSKEREREEGSIEKVDRGGGKEEGKMFRPFTGKGRRMDAEAVTVESGGCSAAVGRPSRLVVEGAENSKEEGGKEAAVMAESGGRSAVAGRRSRLLFEGGKKGEKDGGKEEVSEVFKPFTGRSYTLGGL